MSGRAGPRRRRRQVASTPLGERITAARHVAGLTQEQLAERVDCSLRLVQAWEYGASEPRAGELQRIAQACGVAVSALVA